MTTAALLIAGVLLVVLGGCRVVREPRRLSTGFVLLAAIALLATGFGMIATNIAPVGLSRFGTGAIVALVPMAVGLALILNGVAVTRREGPAPTTLTPVAVGAGLLVLVGVILAVAADPAMPVWVTQLIATVGAVGLYLVAHLIAFGGYALLYNTLPDRVDADAVVMLGCGLNRGSVTPLLAARLDRGIRAYHAAIAAGARPIVITCGGKGSDEITPEADAMARYLTAHGIPEPIILRERRSRNTRENLRNCLRELHARGIPAERLRMTVVTSNFHVLRTAALTRRLGVDAQVLGARTAWYFVPAAFLREFFAVLATHYRRTHLVVTAVAVTALVVVATNAVLTVS